MRERIEAELHVHVHGGVTETKLIEVLQQLTRMEIKMGQLDDKLNAFADSTNASFTTIRAGVANITGDIVRLAKEVEDLKAQIAQNPGDTLSSVTQAKLDQLNVDAQDLAQGVSALAAMVPDHVEPPVEG